METKHTQGKWILAGGNCIVPEHQKGCLIANICSADNNESEEKANAKLIASAPEMLELLNMIKIALDVSTEVDRKYWSKKIDNLIKQATE